MQCQHEFQRQLVHHPIYPRPSRQPGGGLGHLEHDTNTGSARAKYWEIGNENYGTWEKGGHQRNDLWPGISSISTRG